MNSASCRPRDSRGAHFTIVLLGLLALMCFGAVAAARADITIESGPSSFTRDTTPTFGGSTSDELDPVTLLIYAGSSAQGTPVQEAGSLLAPGGSTWSVSAAGLEDNTYTAVAEQSGLLGLSEPLRSAPRTFTVDTTAPEVSLNAVPSPSNEAEPTLGGNSGTAAGDQATVTVTIRAGSKLVTSAQVSAGAGHWSYNAAHLADGSYSAQATQIDGAGNVGESSVRFFTIDTSSPSVTLDQPQTPSNDPTPSFTGSASDTTEVTVRIYAGSRAEGSAVAHASAAGNGGGWSSGEAAPALSDGRYTAIAVQPSSAGNAAGVSSAVSFEVRTAAPHVTLNRPSSPSGDTTPSFTGTASESTTVEIDIYSGPAGTGSVVATAAGTGTGGSWSSGQAAPALPSGQYSAIARQESSLLGNPTGSSEPVTFTIDTSSPTVTLAQPPTPTSDSTPTFNGTASDVTKVVVHIFSAATHSEVGTATATPSSGSWSTSSESTLPSGTYKARATQESSLGNAPGQSGEVEFSVNTNPPTVTLNSPAVRSKESTPSFTGTASDTTTVTVEIYRGAKAEGTLAATATASGNGGAWSSTHAAPALADGQYTAIAKQPSSLGNPSGRTGPVTFTVDTTAPTVTLDAPASPSNQTRPIFTGTASDSTTITITIYKGGSPVSSATASGSSWTSTAASPALESGHYTAVASQPSSLGNGSGTSAPVSFEVSTASPTVTLRQPESPSNNVSPSFSGTASDTTQITITIYKGGSPVSSATANGSNWTSTAASPALESGHYTAMASQPSSLGNPPGVSTSVSFDVDTSSPTVTLTQPVSPSNHTTPAFSGTASGKLPVTVRIYEGTSPAGAEVATATAAGTAGAWSSAAAKPALAQGTHTYTAVASQESPLGNPAGRSAPVTFTVDTTAPVVTLAQPAPLSNDSTPTFSGTATDTTPVNVRIYAGLKAEGTVVATASAQVSAGKWKSGKTSPALNGTRQHYTAVAVQPSSIGNPAGTSKAVFFTVDTGAPTLALDEPAAESNDPTPGFSGSTDEPTQVTVKVYAGTLASGTPVATVATSGASGDWTTGALAGRLPDGRYTADATQTSRVGNSEAVTAPVSFTIDTVAPQVTLSTPVDGSSSAGVSQLVAGLDGGAPGDLPKVTVQLFSGATIAAGAAPLQSIDVASVAQAWSTTLAGLSPGTYSVRAEQSDGAGNVGVTSAASFSVGVPVGSAPPAGGPAASFATVPSTPTVGEPVLLVSQSSDPASPLVGFAWDLTGSGIFASSGPSIATTFATAGKHLVQLRVSDAAGRSAVVGESIMVSPAPLPLMQPFPIVRITSVATRAGVRLRLLSVLAPIGAQINVRCRGRGCPKRAQSHLAGVRSAHPAAVEFHRFERSLKAGAVIEVRVSKPGTTGKFTSFTVRRGRRGVRLDACITGPTAKASACPTS